VAIVVAIAGQKGGTGKSTVAVNLAAHWHERGLRVLLADADPQATAATWADVAAEHGHPAPPCVRLGDSLRRDLPALAAAFDVVVLDAPGRAAGARQVGALLVADVVVLPCGPSAPDAWGLAGSVDTVREVLELRPDLFARVLLNRADRTAMTRSAHDALAAVGLPALTRSLGARVAFAEALAAGRGVTSYASGSIAAHELRQLAAELETLAGLTIGDADP
jgi:chromosome partitioning protein